MVLFIFSNVYISKKSFFDITGARYSWRLVNVMVFLLFVWGKLAGDKVTYIFVLRGNFVHFGFWGRHL